MSWNLQKIPSCESTNTVLKDKLISGEFSVGTVLLAENQTKGRGRLDRSWLSPPGNLALSFSCPLPAKPESVYELNLVMALSLCRILQNDYHLSAKLKWPNDVWVGEKKLCGILSDSLPQAKAVIIGVGINFNSLVTDFPKDLQPILTTLKQELGQEQDQEKFLKLLFKEFENDFQKFDELGLRVFLDEIHHNLKFIGQKVNVVTQNQKDFVGKILGIGDDGFLQVDTLEGIKKVVAGDIVKV